MRVCRWSRSIRDHPCSAGQKVRRKICCQKHLQRLKGKMKMGSKVPIQGAKLRRMSRQKRETSHQLLTVKTTHGQRTEAA